METKSKFELVLNLSFECQSTVKKVKATESVETFKFSTPRLGYAYVLCPEIIFIILFLYGQLLLLVLCQESAQGFKFGTKIFI